MNGDGDVTLEGESSDGMTGGKKQSSIRRNYTSRAETVVMEDSKIGTTRLAYWL